jgi:hypothetical protein
MIATEGMGLNQRWTIAAGNTGEEAPRDIGLGLGWDLRVSRSRGGRSGVGSGGSDSSAFNFRPEANSHQAKLSAQKLI